MYIHIYKYTYPFYHRPDSISQTQSSYTHQYSQMELNIILFINYQLHVIVLFKDNSIIIHRYFKYKYGNLDIYHP